MTRTRRLRTGAAVSPSYRPVAPQFGYHGAVHRHMPGPTELRLPDSQKPLVQIDISTSKIHSFGNTQPGRRNQSEDRLISHRPRGAVRRQLPGRDEEVADLLVGINVRCQPPVRPAEDRDVRKCGGRIQTRQISSKWPENLKPAGPGAWPGMSRFTFHPIENDPGCQRSGVTGCVDKAGERGDLRARNAKIKAKEAAFGELVVGQCDH
jgi:hypothetical protein